MRVLATTRMIDSIVIKPLVLSTSMLVLLAALASGWWTEKAMDRERAFVLRGWPTTIYLDAHGRVVASDVGGLSSAKLDQRLDELHAH
jgi:hypothetical protein